MKRPWLLIAASIVLGELMCFGIGKWVSIVAIIALIVSFAYKKWRGYSIFCLTFLLGVCSMSCVKHSHTEKILGEQKIYLRVHKIEEKEEKILFYGRHVLIYADKKKVGEDICIGNLISCRGEFFPPRPASNPGSFCADFYYKSIGIEKIAFVEEVEIVDHWVNWPKQYLFDIKRQMIKKMQSFASEEVSGFLEAALLGEKSDLSPQMYQLYRKNGIAHLLAISGLHISILGMSLYQLLRKRLRWNFLCSGLCASLLLYLYSEFTGASVSVLRASSMLVLFFVSQYLGRSYDLLSAMAFSASWILLFSPYQLFQCGFLLSFLAILAIGGPAMSIHRLLRDSKKKEMAQALAVSLSIQIVTMPVIAYFFFSIPLYGVLINLLVIPLMGMIIWSGIFSLCLSAFCIPLAKFMIYPASATLFFYQWICNLCEKLPGHSLLVGRPSMARILISYGIMFFLECFMIFFHQKKKVFAPWKVLVVEVVTMLFFLLFLHHPYPKHTQVTFLDVGQGDGIFLQVGGENIFVDAGSSSNKKLGEYVLCPFLGANAVHHLDAVFLTHADIDHINGILWLIENSDIVVEKIYLPEPAREDEHYDKIKALAKDRQIPILYCAAGDEFLIGRGKFTCLSPKRGEKIENVNAQSIVLWYQEKDFSMMLMGDARIEEEEEILHSKEICPVYVLKAGHHGSKTSTGDHWLRALRPNTVILSYGKKNRYGHPSKEVLKRLEEAKVRVFSTQKSGAIRLETDGKRMKIRGYKRE